MTVLLLFSCREEDYDKGQTPVPTTVTGRVFDPTTNKPFSNYSLTLKREWKQYCGGVVSSCWHEEKIAEVKTDNDGYYNYTFGYIPENGRGNYRYYLEFDSGYRLEIFDELKPIEMGKTTDIDFPLWKPVKFNFKATIIKNNNPPFSISVDSPEFTLWPEFGHHSSYTENEVINDFFFLRPNTDCYVKFRYYINNQEHLKKILLHTNEETEIYQEYNIDCSTF
ncbi:MAG: carboxypeptidase-like regulatory domain-containing protein [Bergeyella sp.]